MFLLLVLLFTVIPALEIYLLFTIGGQIGGFNTLLVVITTGVVGAALAKSQGMSILNQIQTDLSKGHIPANQFIHCLLIFGGGLLLLTPGFLTDILGISMVLPGTRNLIALFLKSAFSKMIANGNVKFYQAGNFQDQPHQNTRGQVDENTFEAEYKKSDK